MGIEILRFNPVHYSKKDRAYFEQVGDSLEAEDEIISISGSEAREMFNNNKLPPSWYIRPKISKMILTSIKDGIPVFL